MKPTTNANGERYYSYILNYVDYVLVISEGAGPIIHRLDKYFKLKAASFGPPANYLGIKLHLKRLPNGVAA